MRERQKKKAKERTRITSACCIFFLPPSHPVFSPGLWAGVLWIRHQLRANVWIQRKSTALLWCWGIYLHLVLLEPTIDNGYVTWSWLYSCRWEAPTITTTHGSKRKEGQQDRIPTNTTLKEEHLQRRKE